MPEWVDGTQRQLARSSRPGYCGRDVAQAVVDEWLSAVLGMGIRSIICLLTEEQLAYYGDVPSGLLDYCRSHGLAVKHHPITDPAHDPAGWEELEAPMEDLMHRLQELPKPVLVHCSAGRDRTGYVVKYLVEDVPSQSWTKWAEEALEA